MIKGTPFLDAAGNEIGQVVSIDPYDPTRIVVRMSAPSPQFIYQSFAVAMGGADSLTIDEALARGREAFE